MTSDGPIFSIVLPTYNRSMFVGSAIRSVLEQTFREFELIIVDDGSTDDTAEIVEAFKDSRIRYHYKENEERSIARNFGIAKSSGTYVNFLDSDDLFYPHHLETAYQHLVHMRFPELLHLDYEFRRSSGETVPMPFGSEMDINRRLIFSNPLNPASFFIRRDILQDVSFIFHREATFSEDWCLWLRLAARFPVHRVNCVSSIVQEHPQRSLNTIDPNKLERSLLLVIEDLQKDPMFMDYYRSCFAAFLCECYSLIALHFAHVDKGKSIRYFSLSAKVYPRFVVRRRFWAILKNLIFGN